MKNQKLAQLVYGMSNQFLALDEIKSNDETLEYAVNILNKLTSKNVRIKNLETFFKLSKEDLDLLEDLTQKNIKGYILRKNFLDKETLEDYSSDDWDAIVSQYLLVYGGFKEEKSLISSILDKIMSEKSNLPSLLNEEEDYGFNVIEDNDKFKDIEILNNVESLNYIKGLIESKIPYRNNVIEILENFDFKKYNYYFKNVEFNIGSNEAFFIKLLLKQGVNIKIKNVDILTRVAISLGGYEDLSNGQLSKSRLNSIMLNYTQKEKNIILKNVESLSYKVDDFLKFRNFWKVVLKQCNLRGKRNKKYIKANKLLDKLYDNSVKNPMSEFELALKRDDYKSAFNFLSENKKGLLPRYILMFLRYVEGTKIASKVGCNIDKNVRTVKQDALSEINKLDEHLDGIQTKTIWQLYSLLRQIKNGNEFSKDLTERFAHNHRVMYDKDKPLPKVNKKVAKIARKSIKKLLGKNPKNIYIDKSLKNYKMSYSGNSDASEVLSGGFYTQGSRIPINFNKEQMVRFGIAWRGEESTDVDLSSRFIQKNSSDTLNIYYNNPVLKDGNDIVACSSGDITTCSNDKFSVEFIDVDMNLVEDYSSIISYINVYSGMNFNDLECYFFYNVIDKSERVYPEETGIIIDLNQQDFAIRINSDKGAVIGTKIDLDNMDLQIINYGISSKPGMTIGSNDELIIDTCKNVNNELSLYKALNIAHNNVSKNKAEVTIGVGEEFDLDPTKDLEKIQKYLF